MPSPSRADRSRLVGARARIRRTASDRGSVAAEFAVVVPVVMLLLALCLSGLQVATHQLRAQDAAAVAARLAARGEPDSAHPTVARLVPGAAVSLDDRGDMLCARVVVGGPPGPFAGLSIAGSSCAPVAR